MRRYALLYFFFSGTLSIIFPTNLFLSSPVVCNMFLLVFEAFQWLNIFAFLASINFIVCIFNTTKICCTSIYLTPASSYITCYYAQTSLPGRHPQLSVSTQLWEPLARSKVAVVEVAPLTSVQPSFCRNRDEGPVIQKLFADRMRWWCGVFPSSFQLLYCINRSHN